VVLLLHWVLTLISHRLDGSDLVTYQAHEVPLIWPYVQPHIVRAEPYGDLTADDIYKGLVEGGYQLWTSQSDVIEAALVTCITEDREACWLLAVGGENMKTWINWLPLVIDWAKSEGCKELRVHGRPGWSRAAGFEIARMIRAI
jgi:hypothetical protein